MVDAVVAGHLCLDLIPEIGNLPLTALAQAGRLFDVGGMHISTGGGAANTGLALHKLGIDTALMATVGDDMTGQMIASVLNSHDQELSRSLAIRSGAASSYTVVLSPQDEDRVFIHYPGTNRDFCSDDVDYAVVKKAKIFHMGYPPILPRLIANDGADLEAMYRKAKATGTVTSMDTSLPDPSGASGHADWRAILSRVLPLVDIFVPSIEEIVYMLRRDDYARWQGRVPERTDADYLDSLAVEIAAMGCPAIVGFKLGDMGLYLHSANADRLSTLGALNISDPVNADKRIWQPAFDVPVVGTTGAGDAAYAGLLASLIRGATIEEAARWACAVGACCVEAADAASGIRAWDEISARLQRNEWRTKSVMLKGWKV